MKKNQCHHQMHHTILHVFLFVRGSWLSREGSYGPKTCFFFHVCRPFLTSHSGHPLADCPSQRATPCRLEAPAPKKGKSRLAPGSPWDQFPGTRGGLQSPRPGSGRRRGLPWRVGMIFSWAQMDQMLACMTGNRLKRAHFYPCPTGNRPDFCRRELHASRWNFWSGFWCIVSLKSLFTFAY